VPTVVAKTDHTTQLKVRQQCEYQFDTAQATEGTQSVLTCRNLSFVPKTIAMHRHCNVQRRIKY